MERLLESGPVWTSTNIRHRDNGHYKVMGRWRRWKWRPLYTYRVLLPEAEIHILLSYANRGPDWSVTANDYDLEKWFKDNGKGLMRFTFYPKSNKMRMIRQVEIGFTDKNTATMCKLAMGGRM